MAYPLPRNVGHVEADIRLRPVGDRAVVEVDLQPADAAKSATAFGIVSWQGGGRVSAALDEVGPGRYVSSKPVPITGRWKTMVGLQRGDQVMAAAIYMPEDTKINAPAVEPLPERHETFVRNTKWLLREQKVGGAFAANVAYTGVSVVLLAWIGLYALCAVKLSRPEEDVVPATPAPPTPAPPTSAAPPAPGPTPRETVGAGWRWSERWPVE
jgi:hypothetical protein